MEILIQIFGEGKDLTTGQMGARAFIIYFIALILLRISGRRTFGSKSAFDNTIVIILGAVLSRAVVGASPFVATVTTCLILVSVHRLLAWVCLYSDTISRLLKGSSITVFKNGEVNKDNMKRSLITENDLAANIRLKGNINDLHKADEIVMETTGEISVVKKTPS